jgi:hypothetical protein
MGHCGLPGPGSSDGGGKAAFRHLTAVILPVQLCEHARPSLRPRRNWIRQSVP